MRVPGIHGSKRKTYPSTIGTSGSSAIGFLAIRRRATSTREATMASVLVYQRTGLPIAAMTCNFPSGVANREERRKPRSMIGQLHHGDPEDLTPALDQQRREQGREHEEEEEPVHDPDARVGHEKGLAGYKGGQEQGRHPLPEVVPAEGRPEGDHGHAEDGRHQPPPQGGVPQHGYAGGYNELPKGRGRGEDVMPLQELAGHDREVDLVPYPLGREAELVDSPPHPHGEREDGHEHHRAVGPGSILGREGLHTAHVTNFRMTL